RHTRSDRDWSSDVCSSDLEDRVELVAGRFRRRGGRQDVEGELGAEDRGGGSRRHGDDLAAVLEQLFEAVLALHGGGLNEGGDRRSEERRVGKEGGAGERME